VKLYVRSYDRRHTLQLIAKDVDFSVRETFESALVLGRKALETLGIEPERAGAVIDFVRSRDQERLVLQQAGGDTAGVGLLRSRMVQEPLSEPEREARALNPEAEAIIESEAERSSAQ
jgi:voltage-gated potassium channel Kch